MNSNISTKDVGEFEMPHYLPECQSTNDVLLDLLRQGDPRLKEGFLVYTGFQSSGRGQRGNTWLAERDRNLLCSFLLYPKYLQLKHGYWLSAAVALGVCEGLQPLLPKLQVKWPNDLYSGALKLGGLLLENGASGLWLDRSVVGLGLNGYPAQLPEGACSIFSLTGEQLRADEILQRIWPSVWTNYQLLSSEGWEKIRSKLYLRLLGMGQLCRFSEADGPPFTAIIKGITEDGQLHLIRKEGEKRYSLQQVRWLGTVSLT
jgi:BirA family transcriptional regulator, biotin operon repressor / biotin---[acetyl-CoA-carboxylase] ligase